MTATPPLPDRGSVKLETHWAAAAHATALDYRHNNSELSIRTMHRTGYEDPCGEVVCESDCWETESGLSICEALDVGGMGIENHIPSSCVLA